MSKGGGDGEYVVGYWYTLGMHLLVLRGAVDSMLKFFVGDREAWSGEAADEQIYINQPDLHGGQNREGGFVGYVDVEMGGITQGQNDYLVSQQDSDISAHRGVVGLVLRACRVCANNPYLKPLSGVFKRTDVLTTGEAQWYSAKADVGNGMNPAHMIREAHTSDDWWAKGIAESTVDDAALQAVADTLYSENLGLNFLMDFSTTTVDDFIKDVLRYIDGSWFQSMITGEFKCALARADYSVGELETFGEADIETVVDFCRPTEAVNHIVVKYTNPDTYEEASLVVNDLAAMQIQGGVISKTVDYSAVMDGDVAVALGSRDLKQSTAMLAKMTIIGKRTMSHLEPNGVFILNWPSLGIDSMIVRVAAAKHGTLESGLVKLDVAQDVFGTQEGIFSSPPASGWVDPVSSPVAVTNRNQAECPYWTIVREVTNQGGLGDFDPDGGILTCQAERPVDDAINYDVALDEGGGYFTAGSGQWTPTALLDGAIGLTDTTLSIKDGVDLDQVELDRYIQIDDELMAVTDLDTGAGEITVDRGVLDTVPAVHADEARIWFGDHNQALVVREYIDGEDVDVKYLTRTGKGLLAEGSAPADNFVFDARAIRPYPPGKVRINTLAYPASISGELTVDWAHRDREQQTAYLVTQDENSIGPESGTTYTLRIYGDGDVLKHTESGISGTTYTYPEATEKAENGGNWNSSLRIELEAVRDGWTSWQFHNVSFTRV
jgi:hypothetical protein